MDGCFVIGVPRSPSLGWVLRRLRDGPGSADLLPFRSLNTRTRGEADLQPQARLLEIGSATGKATVPLARRGYEITCVELGGADLAFVAKKRLTGYSSVRVINADFDVWSPSPDEQYDLVFAATAWHWLNPTTRYKHAARLLRPRGYLAVWSAAHVFPEDGDPFFEEVQAVYDEIGEGLPTGAVQPRPGELAEINLEGDSKGLFRRVSVHHFDWETVHGADSYIDLLNTFSGHITMQPWQRKRLYTEIRQRLATRPDGQLRRHWGAVLEIARLAS
jgi:SAM-dependent methyltransferase